MSANPLMIMEAANLFAGKADPTASNHLTLSEVKLPTMETTFVDFAPAGAPVAIEIPTHINKPECTFTLAGITPQVMGLFWKWSTDERIFTVYGLVRDQQSGSALQAIAEMRGQLGRVAPSNYQRGSLHSHEYSIKGITHYNLVIGERQVYFWNFFTQTLVINGEDALHAFNNALNIPPNPIVTTPNISNQIQVPLTSAPV